MNLPGATLLSRLILRVRRSSATQLCKRFLPQPLRGAAWRLAIRQEIFTVCGSQMYIPPDTRNRSIVLDQYEPPATKKIRELLRPGMTFCDVGANVGVFTLLASKLVGTSGRVLAFEPVPGNCEILCRNIALNKLTNISVFHQAVSDQPGQVQIHLSDYMGSHSMIPGPARATGAVLTVEAVRLDGVPGLQQLDFLKVDTEGTELLVLRSLGTIRPSHLVLECNMERLQTSGSGGKDFLLALHQMGYHHIENLDAPAVGIAPIEAGQNGSWNLYASCEST